MIRDRRIPAIAALVVLGYLFLPGDVPWILDEPKLFAAALEANRAGTLYRFNPHAFAVLVDLAGGRDAAQRDATAIIRYREPGNPFSAWLSLECPANPRIRSMRCSARR